MWGCPSAAMSSAAVEAEAGVAMSPPRPSHNGKVNGGPLVPPPAPANGAANTANGGGDTLTPSSSYSNRHGISIIYAQATKSTVRMDRAWRRMGRVWWPTGPWWPRSRSRRATGRRRPTPRRCPLLAPPTSSSSRVLSSPTRSRGPKRFVVCFAWLFNIQIKWCLTGKCYCGRNSLISPIATIFSLKCDDYFS